METKLLKEEIKEVEMPLDMKERIIEKCKTAKSEKEEIIYMKNIREDSVVNTKQSKMEATTDNIVTGKETGRATRKWTRFATVAAAVALCLGLGSITALAASGKLEGFFADVTDWNGAVVGTTYEQATEEIEVSASVVGGTLTVEAVLLKATQAPYVAIDTFGVKAYQITDMAGNVVVEGTSTTVTEILGDKVSMAIPLNGLESDNYKLIITEFVGDSKADQPLPICGYWECEFEL